LYRRTIEGAQVRLGVDQLQEAIAIDLQVGAGVQEVAHGRESQIVVSNSLAQDFGFFDVGLELGAID